MGEKKETVDYFILFKPIIYKLLVYFLLMYLAVDGKNGFQSSLDSFQQLIDRLNAPILLNMSTPLISESCPDNYVDINQVFVSDLKAGCVCDEQFFSESDCKSKVYSFSSVECLSSNTYYNSGSSSNNCPSGYTCCNKCFSNIKETDFNSTGIKNITVSSDSGLESDNNNIPALFSSFFKDRKICLLYSQEQTTLTYLESINNECDEENICNLYFCKYKNNKDYPCPGIYYLEGTEDTTVYLADNYLADGDYDNYGRPKITLPIISIQQSRNKQCMNNKTRFDWDYPLLAKEDCLHSDRFYELNYFTTEIFQIIDNNYMSEYFNRTFPYYRNYKSNTEWGLYMETAVNRLLIYCLSEKENLFITEGTNAALRLSKKKALGDILDVFMDLESTKSIAEANQEAMMISAVLLIVYQSLFIILKLFVFFMKKVQNIIEDKKDDAGEKGEEKKPDNNENEKANKTELEMTKNISNDKSTFNLKEIIEDSSKKNKNKNKKGNSNNSDEDKEVHDIEILDNNSNDNLNEKLKKQDKEEFSITNRTVISNNKSELVDLKQENKLEKIDSSSSINSSKTSKSNKNNKDDSVGKNNNTESPHSFKAKNTKKQSLGNIMMKKSKNILLTILKYLNQFSGWITFIVDWGIFLICMISYIQLNHTTNTIDNFLNYDCLDYDSGGQLQAFNIIMIGVAFQSYEIMFLVLVRLFTIVISLMYTLLTKGKVTTKEFMKLCCDNEDEENEKKEEDNADQKKVNTAQLANIDKKIVTSKYLDNLKSHLAKNIKQQVKKE